MMMRVAAIAALCLVATAAEKVDLSKCPCPGSYPAKLPPPLPCPDPTSCDPVTTTTITRCKYVPRTVCHTITQTVPVLAYTTTISTITEFLCETQTKTATVSYYERKEPDCTQICLPTCAELPAVINSELSVLAVRNETTGASVYPAFDNAKRIAIATPLKVRQAALSAFGNFVGLLYGKATVLYQKISAPVGPADILTFDFPTSPLVGKYIQHIAVNDSVIVGNNGNKLAVIRKTSPNTAESIYSDTFAISDYGKAYDLSESILAYTQVCQSGKYLLKVAFLAGPLPITAATAPLPGIPTQVIVSLNQVAVAMAPVGEVRKVYIFSTDPTSKTISYPFLVKTQFKDSTLFFDDSVLIEIKTSGKDVTIVRWEQEDLAYFPTVYIFSSACADAFYASAEYVMSSRVDECGRTINVCFYEWAHLQCIPRPAQP